jgi:molybdopterin converting factor small subunit
LAFATLTVLVALGALDVSTLGVTALGKKVLSLEGSVIVPGEDRLVDEYKFNINGTFYFAGMDLKLKKGDRIALLVPITGG